MKDQDYFSHLYEIASHLNKEFSLHSALRKSLEKTVEILDMETGWVWLTEPHNKSVYLAASHNLPPALSKYPERLSGWCYCIKQYLDDDIEEAMNISEIACSRLKDISSGTKGLKFHATIPITIGNEKVGIINLLSKETRKLTDKELTILNTISELVGTAIQRTRLQQTNLQGNSTSDKTIRDILDRIYLPKMEVIISSLQDLRVTDNKLGETFEKMIDLKNHLTILLRETEEMEESKPSLNEFNYPETLLTKRELEVLHLIKKGLTNEQIGDELFITERTVKFHTTSILSKLNASNRTEAVNIALKRGFFNS